MNWRRSHFRAGDVVEVRTKEEILSTLDQNGCLEQLPFMPEMLQFCGQRFQVRAVAHKTCDTIHKSGSRRVDSTVHLADLRCDGLAHGGCQAECTLFWKDLWLKPINKQELLPGTTEKSKTISSGCTELQISAATRLYSKNKEEEPCYSCQATKLYDATLPLSLWSPTQFLLDVLYGNRSTGQVIRIVWLGLLRWLVSRIPFGYRFMKRFTDWMHQRLVGRATPSLCGRIEPGKLTPTGRMDLEPGEYVRIKSQREIEQTLDQNGKNRGLGFDGEEMALYCGEVHRVRGRVSRIIDETTGKMLVMKQPCIVLDGATCTGEYASQKLLCPRAIHTYWREIWLDRVKNDELATQPASRSTSH